jgi:hypothetical protein
MDLNYSRSNVVNWGYLPDIATLTQYLNICDLRELSKTCKRHRNHLERKALEKLNLDRWKLDFTDRENFIDLSTEKQLDFLLELLESDLKRKYHLVKEITFKYTFHDQYAKKIARLFPHISKLRFSTNFYSGSELGLLTVLTGMKHLEYIEFLIDSYNPLKFNNTDKVFPGSLKSLIIDVDDVNSDFLSIFNTIDSSYSNLTTLSVISNKALENLPINMPNLKDVRLCNNRNLDSKLILEFIKKNPQLDRLEARFITYSTELFDAILSSKYLSYFYIDYCLYEEFEISKRFTVNYSIKKLKFDRDTHHSIISLLIRNCQSLKYVEFCNYDFEEKHISIWNGINRTINTLKFSYCYFDRCVTYIQMLSDLNFFNRATFLSYYSAENTVEELNLDNIDNYKLITNTSEVSSSCIIKKCKNNKLN